MEERTERELVSILMKVDVPYRFAAGRYMTKFLTELRDHGKLFGVKCPECKRVMLPPRIVCGVCHVKSSEWVELGDEGTVTAFTIVYIPLTDPVTGKPHKTPYVYGTIIMDHATSGIDHIIDCEPTTDEVWVGMRVKMIVRDRAERRGDLSDIRFFKPIEGQSKQN